MSSSVSVGTGTLVGWCMDIGGQDSEGSFTVSLCVCSVLCACVAVRGQPQVCQSSDTINLCLMNFVR